MFKSIVMILALLSISSCATQPAEPTSNTKSGINVTADGVKPSAGIGLFVKDNLVYQCQHGTDGAVISCSALDCSNMKNISGEQCNTISRRLLSHSSELIKFAKKGEAASMKVTQLKFAGNAVVCRFSPEPLENKAKVAWAKYQEMSCFLKQS